MNSSPAADPSTEQILAEIRRSIADIAGETRGRAAPVAEVSPQRRQEPAPEFSQAAAHASDSVVALRPRQTDPDRVGTPPEPAGTPEESSAPQPRYNYTLRREGQAVRGDAPEASPHAGSSGRTPDPQPRPPEAPIMSAEADASVTRAFNGLANTLLSSEARTLEDLVREMLRPMLRTWLDANLPPMVERLVREEIERVARGQRSS